MIVEDVLENYGSFSTKEMLAACLQCMECSDDLFLFIDAASRITYINKAYCDYLGIKKENAIGQMIRKIIPSSRMPDISQRPHFKELNTIQKVSPDQYVDQEQCIIVNRLNVLYRGQPIGAAGQGKIVRNTLKLSEAISSVYAELEYYRNKLNSVADKCYSFQSIIGESESLKKARDIAIQAAKTDFSVLISGETGTGKEIFANAIHFSSNRKFKPIIRVNCAAIPSELLESELFGYEEGSFTGAKRGGKKGKFELANGGTIFLDEIGELPLYMQAKLLRVLQEREVERIGGEKPIPLDIRVISATNKNLEDEVEKKRFRQDLYFRINVIEVAIPPLRDRRSDISAFITSFIKEINERFHTNVDIQPQLVEVLSAYSWPGNVRELRNTIECCYAMCTNGSLSIKDLPANIAGEVNYHHILEVCKQPRGSSLEKALSLVEKKLILDELTAQNGNIQRTAKALGIHRTTLYKRMHALDISREDMTHE